MVEGCDNKCAEDGATQVELASGKRCSTDDNSEDGVHFHAGTRAARRDFNGTDVRHGEHPGNGGHQTRDCVDNEEDASGADTRHFRGAWIDSHGLDRKPEGRLANHQHQDGQNHEREEEADGEP